MRQKYLDMICNSDSLLDKIETRIEECTQLNENTLYSIIEDSILERLYFFENHYSNENLNNNLDANVCDSEEKFIKSNKIDLNILDKVLNNNELLTILGVIGASGLARISDMKKTNNFKRVFANANNEYSEGVLRQRFKELIDLELLEVEKIKSYSRNTYENIYTLSTYGSSIYENIFEELSKTSEKIFIQEKYNSIEEGYFIKTISQALENNGYVVDIVKNNSKKTIKNSYNSLSLEVLDYTDLIISKDDCYYIVNCVTDDIAPEDLLVKIDEIIKHIKTLSFVTTSQDALHKLSSIVDKWITKIGKDNLKGYTFRFTTLDTLKKKEIWQNKGPF